MAWSLPKTDFSKEPFTPAQANAIGNNLRYLKGLDGAVTIQDAVTINGAVTLVSLLNTQAGIDLSAQATPTVTFDTGDTIQYSKASDYLAIRIAGADQFVVYDGKVIVPSRATAPAGINGAMYYDTTNSRVRAYNGTWNDLW